MEHIAILENGDDPTATATWLEHIVGAGVAVKGGETDPGLLHLVVRGVSHHYMCRYRGDSGIAE